MPLFWSIPNACRFDLRNAYRPEFREFLPNKEIANIYIYNLSRLKEVHQDFDQGSLSRAILPEQTDARLTVDTHVHLLQQRTYQRVAVSCSVLQCVAVRCGALQCVAVFGSVLQCAAVCFSALQCAALCCSVLQCAAVCAAVCCSVLQRVAVCHSVLQCVAVSSNKQIHDLLPTHIYTFLQQKMTTELTFELLWIAVFCLGWRILFGLHNFFWVAKFCLSCRILVECRVLFELQNFVRVAEFWLNEECWLSCRILFELQNFVWVEKWCLSWRILFELQIFVWVEEFVWVAKWLSCRRFVAKGAHSQKTAI